MYFASSFSLKEMMDRNLDVDSLYGMLLPSLSPNSSEESWNCILLLLSNQTGRHFGIWVFISVCFASVAEIKLIFTNCIALNFHAKSDLMASCASFVSEIFVFDFELFHGCSKLFLCD